MIAALLSLSTALANPASVPEACLHAEETEVITEDGAWIHLHRHVAEGPPVILVHGISSNHWFMDLGPDQVFAVGEGHSNYPLATHGVGRVEE